MFVFTWGCYNLPHLSGPQIACCPTSTAVCLSPSVTSLSPSCKDPWGTFVMILILGYTNDIDLTWLIRSLKWIHRGTLKLLVLSDQQSKTQSCFIPYYIWQRTGKHPWWREGRTRRFLSFMIEKWLKWSVFTVNSLSINWSINPLTFKAPDALSSSYSWDFCCHYSPTDTGQYNQLILAYHWCNLLAYVLSNMKAHYNEDYEAWGNLYYQIKIIRLWLLLLYTVIIDNKVYC